MGNPVLGFCIVCVCLNLFYTERGFRLTTPPLWEALLLPRLYASCADLLSLALEHLVRMCLHSCSFSSLPSAVQLWGSFMIQLGSSSSIGIPFWVPFTSFLWFQSVHGILALPRHSRMATNTKPKGQLVCWIWEILHRIIYFRELCLALQVKEYYSEGHRNIVKSSTLMTSCFMLKMMSPGWLNLSSCCLLIV